MFGRHNVNTKREIKSFWWSPNHPERKWFGTLTYGPEQSPELELIIERQNPVDDRTLPLGNVIHGKDEHGKPITLLFAGSSGDHVSGAVLKRRFDAGYALIGIDVPNAESFLANTLRFQLQHLYGWLGRSGFERNVDEKHRAFVVKFQQQEAEWFSISPDLELAIHNTFETSNGFQKRCISEDAALTFRSKAGFPLSRCNELISSVRMLLHFAVIKRVYPVWVTTYKDGYGSYIGAQVA